MSKSYVNMTEEQVKAVLKGEVVVLREAVRPQPKEGINGWFDWGWGEVGGTKSGKPRGVTWHGKTCQDAIGTAPIDRYCPYGQVGDVLWVREKWTNPTDTRIAVCKADIDAYDVNNPIAYQGFKWRPSTHMPRWASRLDVVIASIKAIQGASGWEWVLELKLHARR